MLSLHSLHVICHLLSSGVPGTLADDREIVLHMEFQGRRSHAPMPWRMLDYMPRLASTYNLPLESVVLYIGRGRGLTTRVYTTWRGSMARQC